MKLGRRRNYHEGRAAIRHYANLREPSDSLRFKLYLMDPSVGGLMTVTVAVPVSPHAMVSTIAHWWQARVPGRGAGTWGDPENKNRSRQPRVKNINMGRTRHH